MNELYSKQSDELRSALGDLSGWYAQVERVGQIMREAFEAGHTVYVAGNGGSATLAQHLSDEMVGRYNIDRPAYPVVALTADSAVLTVIGNDYGFEELFRRQIDALGRPGDVLIGFSTSGSSKNLLAACEKAKEKGMVTVSFTGPYGALKDMVDHAVISPTKSAPRMQELDLHAIHLLCEMFEPEDRRARLGMNRIDELLGLFHDKRVLIVGDIVLDHYFEGSVERISPEAPVPVLQVKSQQHMTGGAGNVGKNIASLGARGTLISVVGQDHWAEQVMRAAEDEGYTARLIQDPGRPTIRKERYVAKSQQLVRVDHEEIHPISGQVEENLIAALRQAFAEGIDAVIVSDYAKGVITERVAQTILDLGRQYNVPVSVDTKPVHAQYFVGASLITPNLKEGHEFLGIDYLSDKREAASLVPLLRERMQSQVFLTLGPDGVQVDAQDLANTHVPQDHVVEVFDVSGAGDTAISMVTLASLVGASAQEIALLLNAAGAVAVSKVGSVGVTPEEIRTTLMHK